MEGGNNPITYILVSGAGQNTNDNNDEYLVPRFALCKISEENPWDLIPDLVW